MKKISIIIMLMGTFMASWATTYVVTDSADAGAGTLRDQVTAANINAGQDTILFSPSLNGSVIQLSGTAISIVESLVIIGNGSGNTIVRGTGSGNLISHSADGQFLSFQDMTFCHSGWGIMFGISGNIASTVEIRGCEFFDFGITGFRWTVLSSPIHTFLIDNCYFHHSGGGISVHFASGNMSVTNTTFSNNVQFGAISTTISIGGDWYFENNTFYQNNLAFSIGAPSGSNTLKLINNTIAENTDYGIRISEGTAFASQVELTNNIIYDNGVDFAIINAGGSGNPAFDHNIGSTCSSPYGCPSWFISVDPLLDPAGPGNHGGLAPTIPIDCNSPAYNAGTSNGAPPTDQRNFNRLGAPDIGAYEYLGAGVTNLTVSVCDAYTSPSGNQTWTSSGIYNDTLGPAGCDSVFIIDLTIIPSDSPPLLTYGSGPNLNSICETETAAGPAIVNGWGGCLNCPISGLSIDGNGIIDASTSNPGAYQVIALSGGTCPVACTTVVTIEEIPQTIFNYAKTHFCSPSNPPYLPDQPPVASGGTWSNSPAGLSIGNDGTIIPATSGLGTYAITYTVDNNSCGQTSFTQTGIVIDQDKDPTFILPGNVAIYCPQDTSVTPIPNTPTDIQRWDAEPVSASGNVLSVDTASGLINFANSDPGTYRLISTTIPPCGGNDTVTVTLTPLPDPSFTYVASSICVSDPIQMALPNTPADIAGYTYTDLSQGGNTLGQWDPLTGSFDPSSSDTGSYLLISYTSGCVVQDSFQLSVQGLDQAIFNYTGIPYCRTGAAVPMNLDSSTLGTFAQITAIPAGSVLAFTQSGNGIVDLNNSDPGLYQVEHTTTGACPAQASDTIQIIALDDPTFTYNGSPYCPLGIVTPVNIDSTTLGTFSQLSAIPPTAAVTFTQPNNGIVDLVNSDPGIYEILYTTAGPCPNQDTVSLQIIGDDVPTFNYTGIPYCRTGTAEPLNLDSTTLGTFALVSAVPTGAILTFTQAANGIVDLANSDPGIYEVQHTTSGACPAQASDTIEVIALDDPTFTYAGSPYCPSGIATPANIDSTTLGTFSQLSAIPPTALLTFTQSSNGIVDFVNSDPGTYEVFYTTAGPCPNQDTVSLQIQGNDVPTFNYLGAPYCAEGVAVPMNLDSTTLGTFAQITAIPAGAVLNFTQPGNGIVDLVNSDPGTYEVQHTTSGVCPAQASDTIEVIALDDPTFNYTGSPFCPSGIAIPVNIDSTTLGTFSQLSAVPNSAALTFTQFGNGIVDLVNSDPGIYEILYTTGGPCSNQDTTSLQVMGDDVPTFNYTGIPYCRAGAAVPMNLDSSTLGTFTQISAIPAGAVLTFTQTANGIVDLANSDPGRYEIQHTTAGACPTQASDTLRIIAQDDASFVYTGSPYCPLDSVTPANLDSSTLGTFSQLSASPPTSLISFGLPGNGIVDLASSDSGFYEIRHVSTGICPDTATDTLSIYPQRDIAFSFSQSSYFTTSPDAFPNYIASSGGIFSESTGNLSLDPTSGKIDFGASSVGMYKVAYTPNPLCAISDTFYLFISRPNCNPYLSYDTLFFCQGQPNALPDSVSPGGGRFFPAAGQSFPVDSLTGEIDMSNITPGLHTVVYTPPFPCADSATFQFVVNASSPLAFINCPANRTVFLPSNSCEASVTWSPPVYAGGCGNIVLTSTHMPGDTFSGDTTLVSYFVSDITGSTDTCTFRVIVRDTVNPVAICTSATAYLDSTGQLVLDPFLIDGGSFDSCGIHARSVQPANFDCSDVGQHSVLLVVEDLFGNKDSCTAQLTVSDSIAPIAICQDTIVYVDPQNTATVTTQMIDNGSYDNCSLDSLSVDPMFFDTANCGLNPVILTAYDVNGNTSTCTTFVDVRCTNGLNISCNSDTVVYVDPVSCAYIANYQVPTASSLCGAGGGIPVCPLALGDIAFTGYKATDPDSFSFVILQPISANCAIKFTDRGWLASNVFDNNQGESTITWNPPSTLPAGTEIWISGTQTNLGTVTGTPLSLSSGGDQIFAFQGPDPVGANPVGFIAAIQMNGTWDANAGNPRSSARPPVFNSSNSIFIDPEKNNAHYTCTTLVGTVATLQNEVNDPQLWDSDDDPTLIPLPTCGFGILGQGAPFTVAPQWFAGPNLGDTLPPGIHTITWTASDSCGDTVFCSFLLTVLDSVPPIAACQNSTVYLSTVGTTILPPSLIDNGTFDNCGASLTLQPNAFTPADTGLNPVVLTATDPSGNIDTCHAVITLVDTVSNCPYAVISDTLACDDLDLNNGVPTFCVPFQSVDSISSGVIGVDFCLNYDPLIMVPTGNITLGSVVLNGDSNADYYVNNQISGEIRISVFYNAQAASGAELIGMGDIACIEFSPGPGFFAGATADITVCQVLESHLVNTVFACGRPAEYVISSGNSLTSRLVYWDNDTLPLRFDALNPLDYLVTRIIPTDSACLTVSGPVVAPDVNGYYRSAFTGGNLRIHRDIPGDTGICLNSIMSAINGNDCYLTGLVTTEDTSFTPSSAFQLLAMDVNMDGYVTAGDITQIQSRTVLSRCQFDQGWNQGTSEPSLDWRFISHSDYVGNADFTISTTYPDNDGNGFSRYKVPTGPLCYSESLLSNSCNPDSSRFHSVLLGDADGNWNGNSTPVALKTQQVQVELDLAAAQSLNGCSFRVPVRYLGTNALQGFDFHLEMDPGTVQIDAVEWGSLSPSTTLMAWHQPQRDHLLLTSYSTVTGGVLPGPEVYYLDLTAPNQVIQPTDFSGFLAYINGQEVMAAVTGLLDCRVSSLSGELDPAAIQVYPNPMRDRLFIKYEGWQDRFDEIELVDVHGRILMNVPAEPDGMTELDVSGLAQGLYLLRMDGILVRKVVK